MTTPENQEDKDSTTPEVPKLGAYLHGLSPLQAKVEQIRKSNRSKKDPVTPSSKKNEKRGEAQAQGMLPFWPEEVRAMPSALARSALFRVARKNSRREMLRDVHIETVNGIELSFTGETLFQTDEDVFLQLLHLARMQPADAPIHFKPSALIKELRWVKGSSAYNRLAEIIERLVVGTVKIKQTAPDGSVKTFNGHLLRSSLTKISAGDQKVSNWTVQLEPAIVSLFAPASYSTLFWETRVMLSSMLAKWLHSFYSTHAQPYPYKVETIRTLSGSDTAKLYHFRADIKSALEELVKIGFLKSWKIDAADLVSVEKASDMKLLEA